MSRWYAMVLEDQRPLQAPFVGVFVGATTEDAPRLPQGARLLGRVRATRKEAVQEAIDYLRAEMTVEDIESIGRRRA